MPAIFIFTPASHLILDEKIKGVDLEEFKRMPDYLLDIANWYSKEQRSWKAPLGAGEAWQWLKEKLFN
jgi:hypothetical protein